MTMERRHFEAIAAAMKAARTDLVMEAKAKGENAVHSLHGWDTCLSNLVFMCRNTNARFDVARFRKACGAEQ